ncbi:MAG: RNA 2'-phosphotransferase [Pseudomonadales bacterium]|nr:RNA 2'-phosphotransferase [Pseudomonadales bacterium]
MVSTKALTKASKFLSFVLRHKPDAIALELDTHGWANIDELIGRANRSGETDGLDRAVIQAIVDTSDKKRFVISEDGECIRANQGHSIDVDLQLEPAEPPEFLYHGTATRFLDSILKEGLTPQQRQHVNLSTDIDTATAVGQRYDKPVILKINARLMHEKGLTLYLSNNGVWLTSRVPEEFITTC